MIAPWDSMTVFDFWERQELDIGFFIGDTAYLDTFGIVSPQQGYHQTLADTYFAHFTQNFPNFYMYDDHELRNDYAPTLFGDLYEDFIDHHWQHFFGSKNPDREGAYYYFNVTYGDVAIFVLDVRAYRSDNLAPDNESKTMLGKNQKEKLKNWLLHDPSKFKFMASPIAWTSRLNVTDGWSNFLTEREEIMSFISDNDIRGVVLLSTHALGALVQAPPRTGRVWCFSSACHSFVQGKVYTLRGPDVMHPTQKYEIRDTTLFTSDLFNGYAMYFGSVIVDTTVEDPWYEVAIYGYTIDGAHPTKVFSYGQKLSETKPNKAPTSQKTKTLPESSTTSNEKKEKKDL